jgi:hypothetical protein
MDLATLMAIEKDVRANEELKDTFWEELFRSERNQLE